ncbi:uncharacterized protein BT62DRAFT_922426 [Guyanagaster necrorhizus]|uniref:Uncharacterized protein n=1 Tax=Guyanagaster necrorhizus TaxID=856835 RepID=A0A9P7VKC2_9AGAR|nr:uncharacterized protein BT62DRAFT_922426 [Guyanagaster necrorhizus MCA 3950]KAG7442711.1 hypothetical protein BT62DRAFT_922426 [Guyanagaster necrorhizus MCA 3950]
MTTFVPSLAIPVATLIANLIGAHTFIAAYFDSSVADIVEPQDLIVAAAYHASLMHFDLHDSNYKMEHKNSSWDYDASLLLPGEPGYKDGNLSSIPHQLLLPSHAISAPPAPVVIGLTALVPKVMKPEASLSGFQENLISFSPVTKNTISMVLSAVSSGLRATVVYKHQQETGILAPPLVPLFSVSQTTFQWKPIPGSLKFSVPSTPPIDHDTSTPSAVESDKPAGSSPCSVSTPDPASEGPEGALTEAVSSALNSLLSPSPHVYHPLTEMTILMASGKPPHSQCMQQSIPTVSKAPANMSVGETVNHTIYAYAFHLAIDLQFYEPPFHQALESMKLSMLPVAPDSLTKPPAQLCSGWEYVYCCHSNKNSYFIHPPLLFWPCFNCTLAGFPEECIFEGGVGEEIYPLILSDDGAIHCGIDHIEHIEIEIKLLVRFLQLLYEDQQQVVGELTDGLDVIASHEHGAEIIKAYAQVSDLLKSFLVHPGSKNASIDGDAAVSSSDTE